MAEADCPHSEAFAECTKGQLSRKSIYYSQRRLLLEADQRGYKQTIRQLNRRLYQINHDYSRLWDELGPGRQRRSAGRRLSAEWREALGPYSEEKVATQAQLDSVVEELNNIATWALELDWRIRRN